jgi:hypothetical protein
MTTVGDRGRQSDYEVFANISDVMDQLRAARQLAAEDPDPEVRKRASWFVRDVTWVIDMLTRGAGCVLGGAWLIFRFLGKAVGTAGATGPGRLGRTCLAATKVTAAMAIGVAAVTAVVGSDLRPGVDGRPDPAAVARQDPAQVLAQVVGYPGTPRPSLHSSARVRPGRPNGTAPARKRAQSKHEQGTIGSGSARPQLGAGPAPGAGKPSGPAGPVGRSSQVPMVLVPLPSLPVPSLTVAVPVPLPSLPAPSLPAPSLPAPSLPAPSLPLPSLPVPLPSATSTMPVQPPGL